MKTIPKLKNEVEERKFWEESDSTEYLDWSKAESVRLPNLKTSSTAIGKLTILPDTDLCQTDQIIIE